MTTTTLPCGVCGKRDTPGAAYQNTTYGDGVRVHNSCRRPGSKDPRHDAWRCTVCGNVRT